MRGDVAEVFDNLKRLVAAKKALKLKSKTPYVDWQFIVFKHNEHEVDEAKRLASNLGVDRLRFTSPGASQKYARPRTSREVDATKPIVLVAESKTR